MKNSILENILIYFCSKYPYPNELSKARLTKMVYLADWKFSLEHDMQLTDIDWYFNYYGPYVDDVVQCAKNSSSLQVNQSENCYGTPKDTICIKDCIEIMSLEKNIEETLDFVIDKTQKLGWEDFIRLIYSTYPVMSQPRFSRLDLVKLAKEYKNLISNH
jgi:hypothetical protein